MSRFFLCLSWGCLFALVLFRNVACASPLENTPARLEALERQQSRPTLNSSTDITDESILSVESEDALQETEPSRLLGTATHQTLLADSAFLSARTAFQKKHLQALEELSSQTKGHPLSGYVEFWQLLLKLQDNPDDASAVSNMQLFIANHANDYLGERARGELARNAALSGNSPVFEKLWKQLSWQKNEPDMRCFRALMDLKHDPSPNKLNAAKKELTSAKNLQDIACRKLVAEVLSKEPKWGWSFLLVLLQKNRFDLASEFLNSASAKVIGNTSAMKEAISNPLRWYKNNKKKLARTSPRLLAVVALRLASSENEIAARIALIASKRLDVQTKSLVWGRIACQAALNHDPKAPKYYRQAGSKLAYNPLLVNQDLVLAWQVRSYLRTLDWKGVLNSIQKLPTSQAKHSAWIYWRARALEATGKKTQAKQFYQKLLSDHSFYGLLARDALRLPYEAGLKELTPPLSKEKEEAFSANPNLQRAVHFYDLDLYYEGNREWSWAMKNLKKRERLELAQYAMNLGLTHRAINTAASTGVLVRSLLYPRAHEQAVKNAASQAGLPDSWLFGLIRQESRFIANAKSSVGALGLMQVMPRTARWVAKKMALKNYKDGHLTKLDTNLVIGSQYLKLVSDNFGNSVPLSCASYNAGPSRAQLWQSRLPRIVDGAVFAETIPFTETREYVKHVTANIAQYTFGSHDQKRLTDILGKIRPKPLTSTALP